MLSSRRPDCAHLSFRPPHYDKPSLTSLINHPAMLTLNIVVVVLNSSHNGTLGSFIAKAENEDQ